MRGDSAFALVKAQIEKATREACRSLDWYVYVVEPLAEKYRLPMDGDYQRRIWWFVLRPVSDGD